MKGVIAATAVLLTALALPPQAQARDQGNWQRGDQNHGRYDNRSDSRSDNRSNSRPNWNNQGRDHRGWDQPRGQGHNDWRGNNGSNGRNDWHGNDGWNGRNGRNDWHGHDNWNGRDTHRWGRPDYRPYGYRYPRYYYDQPYYGSAWGYGYPPAYRSGSYYDCDSFYDYNCDNGGFSLSFSLPLH